MTVLLYIVGVVVFVGGLAVSIALHECGHMVPAKRFGVRVPQFFVGFGRTVWSTRRGETEYGVKAFPLGGYVKLIGMLPPRADGTPRTGSTGMFSQLVSDARAAEAGLLRPGDEQRMFYRLPWWKKVIVMAGGPTVNLVIAFVLFCGVFAFHGVAEPTTTVSAVADCVQAIRVDEQARPCSDEDPVAPSRAAGIRPGDTIVAFDGIAITSYSQLQHLIRDNGAKTAEIVVERDGTRQTLTATTQVNELPSLDPDDLESVEAGYLGIVPTARRVHKGPGYTVVQMGDYTWATVEALAELPARLWDVARAAVGLEERKPDSPMSVVGASRVAGDITSDDSIDVGGRIAFLFSLLAGVNLFLGMFNFVPLLPLDGGHIAGALYEAVRRGLARLFGRPDPGPFDVARLLPVAYVMAGFLLVMTVLLVYADLVIPVA